MGSRSSRKSHIKQKQHLLIQEILTKISCDFASYQQLFVVLVRML